MANYLLPILTAILAVIVVLAAIHLGYGSKNELAPEAVSPEEDHSHDR